MHSRDFERHQDKECEFRMVECRNGCGRDVPFNREKMHATLFCGASPSSLSPPPPRGAARRRCLTRDGARARGEESARGTRKEDVRLRGVAQHAAHAARHSAVPELPSLV